MRIRLYFRRRSTEEYGKFRWVRWFTHLPLHLRIGVPAAGAAFLTVVLVNHPDIGRTERIYLTGPAAVGAAALQNDPRIRHFVLAWLAICGLASTAASALHLGMDSVEVEHQQHTDEYRTRPGIWQEAHSWQEVHNGRAHHVRLCPKCRAVLVDHSTQAANEQYLRHAVTVHGLARPGNPGHR